jgi:AraC family transcriptional regulator
MPALVPACGALRFLAASNEFEFRYLNRNLMVPKIHPLTLILVMARFFHLRAARSEILLMHELIRPQPTTSTVARPLCGGLQVWQQKRVVEFIEQHLAEDVSLAALAALADLSLYHFARLFKQSFGAPPHRYHMVRRMERARGLLQRPELSVTEIGIQIGFRETSSFTRAFRKFTGLTPTEYRRHRQD